MATNDNDSGSKMPFTEHLEELRHRLIVCFVAVGVGFLICYFFAKQIFEILMRPLIQVMPPGEGLIFTALPEAFITYLKVALLAGIGLASPVIIYQFWRFPRSRPLPTGTPGHVSYRPVFHVFFPRGRSLWLLCRVSLRLQVLYRFFQ